MSEDEIKKLIDGRHWFSEEELIYFARAIGASERAACVKLLEEGAGLPDLSAHSKFDMYVKIFMQRVADQIKERGA
jgi:hypothetical protein